MGRLYKTFSFYYEFYKYLVLNNVIVHFGLIAYVSYVKYSSINHFTKFIVSLSITKNIRFDRTLTLERPQTICFNLGYQGYILWSFLTGPGHTLRDWPKTAHSVKPLKAIVTPVVN